MQTLVIILTDNSAKNYTSPGNIYLIKKKVDTFFNFRYFVKI